jgi:hypothetical protein
MVGTNRRWLVLSTDERQAPDDVQRNFDAEAEELGRHRSSSGGPDARVVDDLPALVVAGIWSAVFLVIFGEMAAALAVATVTALGWASWRWVTAPGTGSGAVTPRDDGAARAGESSTTSGPQRLRRSPSAE